MPQGAISRWIDSAILVICALCSFLTYYFIKYDICRNGACDKLVVTRFWANNPYVYLFFGAGLLIVSVLVAKVKNIPRVFSLGIMLVSLIGAATNSLLFFSILHELKSIT